jgi:hypothetical protein
MDKRTSFASHLLKKQQVFFLFVPQRNPFVQNTMQQIKHIRHVEKSEAEGT